MRRPLAAGVALLLTACGAAGGTIPKTTIPAPTTTSTAATTTTAAGAELVELEESSLPRSSTYSFVEVTLDRAALGRVEPRTYLTDTPTSSAANHLFLHLTIRNSSRQDVANWPPSPFRLLAGDLETGPPEMLQGRPHLGLTALDEKDFVMAFEVPDSTAFEDLTLVLAEEDRIPMALPLTGAVEPSPQPEPLRVSGAGPAQGQGVGCRQSLDVTVLGGRTSIDLLDARFPTEYGSRRARVGEMFLSIDLRILNNGGSRCGAGATNFGNSDVVLWVDGVPRAPITWVNVEIPAGVAEDLTFDFAYPVHAETLEVTVGSEEATRFSVPIEIPR